MAVTGISDVIVPEIFMNYLVARTQEQTVLFQSGVAREDQALSRHMENGGSAVSVPFWQDLEGADAVTSDDPAASLTAHSLTGGEQIAPVLRRAVSFAAADLAGAMAGDDPMRLIADRITPYWARRLQTAALNTINGVFAESNMASDGVIDISTDQTPGDANRLHAAAVIDARGTMGDAAEDLGVMMVHSTIYQQIQKADLINYIPDSRTQVQIPTYMGMRLVQSDAVPSGTNGTNTTYTTYLLAPGALAYGEARPKVPVAVDRDELGGNGEGIEYFVNRRHVALHPMGMSFTGTPSGASPTNAELADGANWARVANRKQVPMAALVTNV